MIFYSPNVHTGGGAVLQSSLLDTLNNDSSMFLLDSRYLKEHALNIESSRLLVCTPSLFGRIKAEYLLRRASVNKEDVFCFHSLPPIFKVSGSVTVFFQNVNILQSTGLKNSPIKVRIRCYLERLILILLKNRVDRFVVQSSVVKKMLIKHVGIVESKIDIAPFFDVESSGSNVRKLDEFLYVADGIAHKNHIRLLEAWEILAKKGHYPKLVLTLGERDFALWENLSQQASLKNLRLENIGYVSRECLFKRYRDSTALIFPSLNESFGLPLIEASVHKTPILASELDYVREICNPVETFNPHSALSIARSVSRFMDYKSTVLKVYNSDEFIRKYVLDKID